MGAILGICGLDPDEAVSSVRSDAPMAILCFHRVLPASRRAGPDAPYFLRQTALDLDRFCTLLDELERRAAVVSPAALLTFGDGSGDIDRPSVVLTFDDGYADVLEFAAPELERRRMAALVCVTTSVVSGAERGFPVDHWYATLEAAVVRAGILEGITGEAWSFDLDRAEDRARLVDGPEKRAYVCASPEEQRRMLEALRRALSIPRIGALPRVLDVAGLHELVRRGFVLGSHGSRHAHLTRLSDRDAAEDLSRSWAFFPEHGLPAPQIVAYPDGQSGPRTESLASAAGFEVGLALGSRFARRSDPRLRLPRLIPTNDPGWFERRLLPLFTAAAR